MNKFLMALSLVLVGTAAHASTLTVEFVPCSDSPSYICAEVYQGSQAQEMSIECSDEVASQISQRMNIAGHSLATNVSGSIVTVHRLMGGEFSKLRVDSLDAGDSDSRPR